MKKPELWDPCGGQQDAPEYAAFLRGKVENARAQIASGQYSSVQEVEARFAARRAAALDQAEASGE